MCCRLRLTAASSLNLVLLELRHEHLILLVRDFGVGVGFHVGKSFLLQEFHGRLVPTFAFSSCYSVDYAHICHLSLFKFFSKILNASSRFPPRRDTSISAASSTSGYRFRGVDDDPLVDVACELVQIDVVASSLSPSTSPEHVDGNIPSACWPAMFEPPTLMASDAVGARRTLRPCALLRHPREMLFTAGAGTGDEKVVCSAYKLITSMFATTWRSRTIPCTRNTSMVVFRLQHFGSRPACGQLMFRHLPLQQKRCTDGLRDDFRVARGVVHACFHGAPCGRSPDRCFPSSAAVRALVVHQQHFLSTLSKHSALTISPTRSLYLL